MARPRKASGTIESIEDCREAVRKLLVQTIDLERLVGEKEKAVAAAELWNKGAIAAAVGREADLSLQIEQYYMTHVSELEVDGKKSYEFPSGVIGRENTPPALKLANRAWKWATATAAVAAKLGNKFLHYKDPELKKDEVKEALKKGEITTEQLKACGLKVEGDEQFFIRLKRDTQA